MTDQEILDRARRAAAGVVAPHDPYEDLLRRRDHKRRNQRITAGVVGIALFAAAVFLVASSPFGSDRPEPADPGAVTGPSASSKERIGFVGAPPTGAEPSLPETGELLLGFTSDGM